MADILIEHIVKRKTDNRVLGLRVLIAAGGLALIFLVFVIFLVVGPDFIFYMPILVAAVIWFAWMLIRRTSVEYEYILTNTELDVDRIISKRSRQRLLSIDFRNFDIMAPYTEKYRSEFSSSRITKKLDASSSPYSGKCWFAVFNSREGDRTLLIFEPTGRMTDVIEKQIPRKIRRN